MPRWCQQWFIVIVFLTFAGVCVFDGIHWVGRTYAGFLVYPNLIVVDNSLPHWEGIMEDIQYPNEVVSLNGNGVDRGKDFYRQNENAEDAFIITFRKGNQFFSSALRPIKFGWADLFWMFGVPLFAGCLFFVYAIVVWGSAVENKAARALFSFGLVAAFYLILIFDSASTHRFFRVYLALKALLPATIVYLSLHFPSPRERFLQSFPYAKRFPFICSLIIGVFLQSFIYELKDPWVLVDRLNMGLIIAAAGVFLVTSAVAYRESYIWVERKRARVILVAALLMVVVPVLMGVYCQLLQIPIPPNLYLISLVIFPFSVAYAMARHDLFQVSAFLKRGVQSALWSYVLSALYTALIVFGARGFGLGGEFMRSAYAPALIFVGMLVFTTLFFDIAKAFLNKPLWDREQRYRETIHALGESLVRLLDVKEISEALVTQVKVAMNLEEAAFFYRGEEEVYHWRAGEVGHSEWIGEVASEDPWVQILQEEKRGLTAFELANHSQYPTWHPGIGGKRGPDWVRRGVEYVLPIRFKEKLTGFLLLGRKKSGDLLGTEDVELLEMLSRSVSVALANAENYRQREEQLEINLQLDKMASLGSLVASFSHEVGNKVGALQGGAHFLADGLETLRKDPRISQHADLAKLYGQLEEDLRFYHEGLEASVKMVREMKEFVRMSDRVESVDLKGCVELVKRILEYNLKGVGFEMEFAEEVPPIQGKPGEIHEILMNLFINAKDAIQTRAELEGEEWKGEIKVRGRREAEWVRLEVEDTGCGIPREHMQKILRGFFTTKPVGKGTGMGISFVRKVLERHGGKMEIESRVDEGTRFILWFPIGGAQR